MKSLLLALLFLLCNTISKADITIYETFDDLKNDTGQKYEGDYYYAKGLHVMGKWVFTFKKEGSKPLRFKGRKVWGFLYKNVLFRFNPKTTIPYAVISIDKVCYYENGFAHMKMINNNSAEGSYSYGNEYMFSKNIVSEFKNLGSLVYGKVRHRKRNDTNAELPELLPLYKCIATESYEIDNVRKCVAEFQKEK